MIFSHRAGLWKTRCMPLYRTYIATPTKNAHAAVQRDTSGVENEEYWVEPQYPQIKDKSFKGQKETKALEWQQEIQNVPTVEEKLIKINMPRYYGYKVVQMNEERLPYNCLPAIQYYTRTLFETVDKEKEDEKLSSYAKSATAAVLDALEFTNDYFRQKYRNASKHDPAERERLFSQIIVEQINRALINNLSTEFSHLHEMEIDYSARHEAFWAVGGIEPPKNVVKSKEGQEWQKDLAKEPIDRFMQYKGSPMLVLRHRLQLQPWKNESEYINLELAKKVPRFEFDPRTLGFSTEHQHGTNIPGYWPSNTNSYGFISYQSRATLQRRPSNYGQEDQENALHAHAIQSSFAWLLAQANYFGFNTYSELTYPFNCQTIITSGKEWSFYEYQLNTVCMHGNQVNENPRTNSCRGTKEMELYKEFDDSGKVVGFNEEVLKHLIQCYVKNPNVQVPVEAQTPYLDKNIKRIADYTNEEKRTFLEEVYKYMSSNRPRHLSLPETYMWEKIYKIDNKTRPLEARRRFFEVFVNPWKRTMDQFDKEYIPKAVRPEGPKSKKKFKPTYFP
ncbi:large ribosomal subunit protein mL65 [Stomoxys calcitrans]|uniref:large ribosomal subunit protein mL65 n=1 Tax=Stomoxys calcitrans TaxID=35570 RepID=UPI0027E298BF|nr:large ribosomal subunit protein mL65 [Stomoxys calcitrans]